MSVFGTSVGPTTPAAAAAERISAEKARRQRAPSGVSRPGQDTVEILVNSAEAIDTGKVIDDKPKEGGEGKKHPRQQQPGAPEAPPPPTLDLQG